MHLRKVAIATTLISTTLVLLTACGSSSSSNSSAPVSATNKSTAQTLSKTKRVLLISVDGLHASDLAWFVNNRPGSTLAQLSSIGVTYGEALTPTPSDSFPGIVALTAGASPKSGGVFYDVSYDRSLFAPGSNCAGAPGTATVYDETIDVTNSSASLITTIDPTHLPLQLKSGVCTPVYPHNFIRVNTLFEVVRASGGYTAWSDKHPAYDIVNGPSGSGVNDLYSPEINMILTAPVPDPLGGPDVPANTALDHVYPATESYDDVKVKAILNEIDGLKSDGSVTTQVPTVFGMNFQEVSVAQKYAGYADAGGTPSAGLQDALTHTDQSLALMVAELGKQKLLKDTLIIITAKHGQSPIDITKLQRMAPAGLLANSPAGVIAANVVQSVEDDVSLLWLKDQSQTTANATTLYNTPNIGVENVIFGSAITDLFQDPSKDTRTPDIIVQPTPGVIYSGASKVAEHGGFAEDDRHVALLVAMSGLPQTSNNSGVTTMQVAPTILKVLGLDPSQLQAVQLEGTQVLPGLF